MPTNILKRFMNPTRRRIERNKIYVISWIDSKELVTAVDSKEKALEWVKISNGKYMYTPLEVH
jgi:hypothetical protein